MCVCVCVFEKKIKILLDFVILTVYFSIAFISNDIRWGQGNSREGKGYPLQYSVLENSLDCINPWGRKEFHRTEQL